MSSWMAIKPRMTFHDYEYSTIGRKACVVKPSGSKAQLPRVVSPWKGRWNHGTSRHKQGGTGGDSLACLPMPHMSRHGYGTKKCVTAWLVEASHVFPCLLCLGTGPWHHVRRP